MDASTTLLGVTVRVALAVALLGPSAASLEAQDPDPTRSSFEDDRGFVYLTTAGSAKRWAARGAPIGATLIGLLAGASAPALCEYDRCTSGGRAFVSGALGGAALGALVGAIVGTLVGDGDPSSPVPPPADAGLRWEVSGGLPSPVEAAGYSSCRHPQSNTSFAVRLGGSIARGRLAGFVEGSTVDFRDSGCEGQGYEVDGADIDETARSVSLLVGVSRPLIGGDRLILDVMGGMARTHLRTQPLEGRQPSGPEVVDAGVGLQLGAGLRAGWYPGFGGGARMGVTLRGDWISASPMGTIPLFSLSIGVWR